MPRTREWHSTLGCCRSDFCICFNGEGIDGCCDWCFGTIVFLGGGCVDNVTCHIVITIMNAMEVQAQDKVHLNKRNDLEYQPPQ